MKAYIIGLFATVCIIILNLLDGITTPFSPHHGWALAIIALVACAVGVYESYFRQKVLRMIEESGMMDELESGVEKMADEIVSKIKTSKEDADNESQDNE